MKTWNVKCTSCDTVLPGTTRVNLCPKCEQPMWAVSTEPLPGRDAILANRWDMWRYSALLPLQAGEVPASLGEGCTPMLDLPALAKDVGVRRLWVKDEGVNPTASFKARGLCAAVTRARGVPGIVVPTAGNAGAALAAYGAAAGIPVRIFAPRTTPRPILDIIRAYGAGLELLDGHIGDAGKAARAYAAEHGWFDVSTCREPYRTEGNKTLGMEVAEQLDWTLPDVIVYPTGGGEGIIGMWKAFAEMREAKWIAAQGALPRLVVAQAAGCAPLVRAYGAGADRATPWENPVTHAAGLRVPGPLGDRLVLRALRESRGLAAAASEDIIREQTAVLASMTGVDAAPEGGCALAVLRGLVRAGQIAPSESVVVFNTGSGASYRA
ncbi:MAG TPA: threonine synthase [Gemmatimonadaceae bacterium]|nr:threonine synthase [Gemmatimonadaceae bacterium]